MTREILMVNASLVIYELQKILNFELSVASLTTTLKNAGK
jgi:hypothetical protein